jgi:hypothetical protein
LVRAGADHPRELKRLTAANKEQLVRVGPIIAGRHLHEDVPPAASSALHLIACL